MAEIQKNYDSYKKLNTRVFALSVDPVKQSRNLAEKLKLSFELLCDEDKHVIDLFSLRNPFEHGGIAHPATFIMNPEGKICYRSLDGTASRVDLSDELKFLEKLHEDAGYKMDTAPKRSWIIPSLRDGWRMSSNLVLNGNFADWKHFLLFPVEMFRMMANKCKLRFALPLLAILVLVLGGSFLFQRQIGLILAKRVIEKRVAMDLAEEQPDGLHVGLCGTGCPMPDRKRAGPCVFVIAGKQLYVVDAGDGATRNLSLMGLQVGRIKAILLTHFHSDHIGGLGEMMLVRWASGGNTQPVEVFGPQGVESVVEGFNRAYELDKAYRLAHHPPHLFPPSGTGGVARPFTIPEGEETRLTILERDGLRVTVFSVDHSPVFPAVGYRFDYKGRSVVISGDTVSSRNLTDVSAGVDLLVHEGLQPELVGIIHEAAVKNGRENLAEIASAIPSYHASPEDAAKIARKAGVRHLVLTHVIPPVPLSYLNAAYLGDAGEFYDGPITVGTDGLLIVMPADSDVIRLRNVL